MGGREWWEGGAVGRGRRVAQEGGVGRKKNPYIAHKQVKNVLFKKT